MATNQALLLTILLMFCTFTHQQSVIIVGAGAAGLAAATRFLAHNVTDVTVLEAEDRIGGRVKSVNFADTVVDLGAEWVDGQSGNVVYEFVKDLDLLGEAEPGWDIILFSDGNALSKELSQEISGIYGEVSKLLDEYEDGSKTVGDLLPTAYKTAVEKKYSNNPATLALALKCLPLFEKVSLSRDSSFSWHDSSAARTYRKVSGVQGQTWKQGKGFSELFDAMAKKINESTGINSLLENALHPNKIVTKINYGGEKPIVTCTDGRSYSADFVLFTPSLGVLKHDHKELFEPNLSEEKVKAIEDLGYGSILKIMVHYNDAWWPNDTGAGGYNFVFTDNDEKEFVKMFPDDPVKDGKSWISSILGVYPWKHTNVIVFYVVGPITPDVEQMSEERIQAGIDALLTKAFKDHQITIPKPDKIIKTNWYSNSHFRGTYSFETVQVDDDVHTVLAKPVKNVAGQEVLFFAGEATVNGHYGTVHGAVESGHREAYTILKKMGIDLIKLY